MSTMQYTNDCIKLRKIYFVKHYSSVDYLHAVGNVGRAVDVIH